MSAPSSLLDEVFELLTLATHLEEAKENRVEAATKYYEAVYLLRRYLQKIPSTAQEVATRQLLQEKVRHYEQVAAKLLADADEGAGNGNNGTGSSTPVAIPVDPRSPVDKQTFFGEDSSVVAVAVPVRSSNSGSGARPLPSAKSAYINLTASQANTRLGNALDLDERNQTEQAVAVYMQAAELFLKAIQAADQCATAARDRDGASTEANKSIVLKRRLEHTLDRVEQLKAIQNKTVVPQHRVGENKGIKDVDIGADPSNSTLSLTKDEIAILKQSSLIASGMFLPWSDQDAADVSKSALQPKSLYTDPDGLLQLSDQQKVRFHQWARPSEIARIRYQQGFSRTKLTPVMVKAITPYTIKQQFVTDCSFIASLCICAAFERRFRKRLITNILHPQTPQGALMYNPEGKYLVKLWLNGVARCVVIDDFLPIDRHGNIICSQTTAMTTSGAASQQLELWVCLIEKAYMKLCGGYDFPGSNSGVDLFSLTGWIPERVLFAKDSAKVRDFETHPERAWERICSASTFGDCLITVSTTSEMTESQADAIGLVTGHAYAVLSVVETKSGTRLLQLKNPWGRKGWTGRYSSGDSASWSDPGLCAQVGYNAELAAKQDDGIFWICWEDILQYFKNFHLSWNPSLFKFRATMHGRWPKGQGPEDDSYNVGDNPQYLLNLSESAISRKATVWILISRHVTKQEQEGCDVTDYLTIHIHRNKGKNERTWYSGRLGNCVLTGAYTNNPHVLVRYDVSDPSDANLSLVLSQYKKANDLAYTLSCFCTEQFSLGLPERDLEHSVELSASWTNATAGGPIGSQNFKLNPMFAMNVVDGGAVVQMRVSTKKTAAVNILLLPVDSFRQRVERAKGQPIIDTDQYKHGFVVSEKVKVKAGPYVVVVSNFHEGQTAPFVLRVCSSQKVKVEALC